MKAENLSNCLQETKEISTSKLIYTKRILFIPCFQTKMFKLFSSNIRAFCPAQPMHLQGEWQFKSSGKLT
jgi:hypothetical protein